MLFVLAWYGVLTFIGWASWPLLARLLPGLPSRGYPYARIFGWLLWGWLYWWLGIGGLGRPGASAALVAAGAVLGLSLWAVRRGAVRRRLGAWLRDRWRLVLTAEIVFGVAFGLAVGLRAAAPAIVGTEKPMELAFINAILRADGFPPHDPWLAGYAISYYYLGYLLTALLATVTATPGPVAFNLAVGAIFGLAAVAAYGLGYDLLAPRWGRSVARVGGLLTPWLVLVVGNWEGLLEVLYLRGPLAFGRFPGFWRWLDILNLNEPPTTTTWPPRFWWWWRASRVLHDTALNAAHQEVIDEFPSFSFLLGDLHPHVLAIPFGLLAVALAWHLYRRGMPPRPGRRGYLWPPLLLWTLVLGGLSFLNTWDFPLYVGLNAAAWGLRQRRQGAAWTVVLQSTLRWSLVVGLLGVLAYFPFYVGFGSQARGILPNVLNPSRGAHLWVMFGPLWVPLVAYGLVQIGRAPRDARRRGLMLALGLTGLLAALAWVMAWAIPLLPAGDAYLGLYAAPDGPTLWRAAVERQVQRLAGPLFLAILGGIALGLILANMPGSSRKTRPAQAEIFPWMLVAWGALLVQVPNFLYLWDQFGTRMNTVFKFYYQAWQLWAVAAAYGTVALWQQRRRVLVGLVGVALAAGLVYPVAGVLSRTNGLHPPDGWSLDGSRWLQRTRPDDWAAAQALAQAPLAPLAEAVGGSYSDFARLSTYSGQPAVVGWLGHEGQWRGGYEEVGSRPRDMEILYTTQDWETAQAILERYGIRYVALGDLERQAYGARPDLWERHLRLWWQQGNTRIYLWEPAASSSR